MSTEAQYSTLGNTTIVRRERDPVSGWMITFMVMVILIGLGFISLMDLSAQQKKTERDLFELKQELAQRRLSERLSMNTRYESEGERTAGRPEQRYEVLNQSNEEAGSGGVAGTKENEASPTASPGKVVAPAKKVSNADASDSAH